MPYNALHDRGYRSIGCAPCTRAVEPGEDVRAGRWWWENPEHKECGLHRRPVNVQRSDRRIDLMSTVLDARPPKPARLAAPADVDHLAWLESEAIHILREVAGQCANPALLFSGGKDSLVLLRLAEKAFRPGRFPFPLLHIDTGHNFPEVIAFRDARAAELGERLIVRSVEDSIAQGRVVLKDPDESRNRASVRDAARRDRRVRIRRLHRRRAARRGEGARQGARVLASATPSANGTRSNQRPELWNLYNARVHKGEHVRVFPISNWTELDVWQYIERERLEVPSIYYAHTRPIVRRRGALVPVTHLTPPRDGESVEHVSVRFRTVGDITVHGAGRIRRGQRARDHRRDRGRDDHRARRHAPRRPDQRRVDGAAQEGGVLLMSATRSICRRSTTACCGS